MLHNDFDSLNCENRPLVQVFNVTKVFKNTKEPAIKNVSISLQKGEMAALVGADGAGKTTFLRMLSGLLIPTGGKILINGFSPVLNLNNVKEIIGYMPQKFGLYEDLTVIENLNLYIALNNAKNMDIDTLLEFAGLLSFKNRLAGKLSGGMKQKLGLCCILISNPKLLLLDEPSVGVDPLSRRELMKIVERLVKKNDITVIWSTSYLDEAEKFERVFLFSDGEKIYDGNPKSAVVSKKDSFEEFITDKIKENKKAHSSMGALLQIKEKPDVKTEENTIVICAEGLAKTYGRGGKVFVAVDNISFKIKKGEIFGLLGPNGAGKSTTFKMLCGLVRPTSGVSSILGVKMSENPVLAKSYFGYTAQKFSLFGNLSVRQNLNFFAGVHGLFGFKKLRRIETLLEFFDLKKYENFNTETLPLGFKQRLALSCAIVHKPPVLFLDEPTSGVDPLTRQEFWAQINSLALGGTTVLVTTHFMDEALYCSRISLIYKGKSLVTDTPAGLKNLVKTGQNPNPTMEDAFIKLILREETKDGSRNMGSLK